MANAVYSVSAVNRRRNTRRTINGEGQEDVDIQRRDRERAINVKAQKVSMENRHRKSQSLQRIRDGNGRDKLLAEYSGRARQHI